MDAVSASSALPRLYLTFSRDNDITDTLELTFSTDDERFGETTTIDLKPGGSEIEVTNENKKEYVESVYHWCTTAPIANPAAASLPNGVSRSELRSSSKHSLLVSTN